MLALLLEHDGKKQLDLQAVGGMGSTALQLAVVRRDFTVLRLMHFHTTFTRLSHDFHTSLTSLTSHECNILVSFVFSAMFTRVKVV